jgi:serine protease SohB
VFVLGFHGDIRAHAVRNLREEISALLTLAEPEDSVVVRLESSGGMVHAYGLAAAQLTRIRERGIPLTVCVDKVAASGGYLMACVADRIVAAPFAMVGSIGVLAQIPNFHRLLKKHDIDYELLTAGQYKRTLTVFGRNTDTARQKFAEELEDTHALFREFVQRYRPGLDVAAVATGEVWFGERAQGLGLVDTLGTSDALLQDARTRIRRAGAALCGAPRHWRAARSRDRGHGPTRCRAGSGRVVGAGSTHALKRLTATVCNA